MPDTHNEAAVRRLVRAGASFALCGRNKRPVARWGGKGHPIMVSEGEAVAHLRQNDANRLAIILETVGLACVDFDGAPPEEQMAWIERVLPAPMCVLRSQGGGHHAYYRLPDDSNPRTVNGWQLPRFDGKGDPDALEKPDRMVSGDLKCAGGYVMLPFDNARLLAEALLDGDKAAGVWDSEMARLFAKQGSGLPEALATMRATPHGNHNPTLNKLAYHAAPFRREGVVWRAFDEMAKATGHSPARVKATIERALNDKLGALPKPILPVPKPKDGKEEEPARVEPLPGKPGIVTVEIAVARLGWEFSRDTLLGERQVRYTPDGPWQSCTDDELTKMRRELAVRCTHKVGSRDGGTSLAPFEMKDNGSFLRPVVWAHADAHPRNPLLDWLEACKRKAVCMGGLDGKGDLLDTWMEDLFEFRMSDTFTEESLRWISRRMVCASVARILRPGTAWPRMVVLQGPQGIGKSQLVRHMLPSHLVNDYHTDELHFGMREREMIYAVKGKLWVECSEMRGRAKDIGDMRSFITRTVDGSGERLAYRKDAQGFPRTCVIVGTANHHDCVPADEHGTRRYFVVPIVGTKAASPQQSGAHVKEVMDIYRDLLYGLAYLALEEDEQFTGEWGRLLMDERDLSDVFRLAAEGQQQMDELEESVRRFVAEWERQCTELGGHFLGQELAEYCGLVGLAPGQARYERWASKPWTVTGRVKRILMGKNFGLVYRNRYVGWDDMEQVCAWWHADPAEGEIPGKGHQWLGTDARRSLLGIPTPQDLIDERRAVGEGRAQEDGTGRPF